MQEPKINLVFLFRARARKTLLLPDRGGGRHWGSWASNSTLDSHDESMEVTKDLQKNCSGLTVTLNQSNADYTLMLNSESKHNRGLLRTNSQIQVANRAGDILGTSATRTVGNATKDACQLILADWQAHGRINVPASGPSPCLQHQRCQRLRKTSPISRNNNPAFKRSRWSRRQRKQISRSPWSRDRP